MTKQKYINENVDEDTIFSNKLYIIIIPANIFKLKFYILLIYQIKI